MTSLAGWPTGAVEGEDVVRTIFITGFPPDTKERELQNLLRWWPGYESCQLSYKGDQPMGFALFSTSAMAFAARDALQMCFHFPLLCVQGLLFDVESNAVLRAEMAKKNLFRKKGAEDPAKRLRVADALTSYVVPGAASYDPYGAAAAAAFAAAAVGSAPAAVMPRTVASTYTPSKVYKDNPPCNTLYIGNLSPFVNETEILSVFGTQPGYVQMKLTRQGVTNTCCFVQYSDIASASAVHAALQGTSLASSDRGPIRIQFSKNPLGVKGPGFGGGMGGMGGMGGVGGVGGVGGAGEFGGAVKSEIGPVAEPPPAGTDGGAGGAAGVGGAMKAEAIGAEAAAAAALAAASGLT
ncbi:unnamed protein product [Closterium sp. Yama58-4]|nr:unnamed protein product [Closterium sp. Yama58-4]